MFVGNANYLQCANVRDHKKEESIQRSSVKKRREERERQREDGKPQKRAT